MKRIPLTRGKFALVDDEDYDDLMQWKWCASSTSHTFYSVRGRKAEEETGPTKIYMHRAIMRPEPHLHIDHINGDGLDNRRCNLRSCINSQNQMNKGSKRNASSKYIGVSWDKALSKWRAQIIKDRKRTHLGLFNSEIEAALAYDTAARTLHGEFAQLNFNSGNGKGNSKMGLGLPTGASGDFVVYIKYNAKAGRWYTKNDAGEEYEVEKPRMVVDFHNIKTGAFKYGAGVAPELNFDTVLGNGDAAMPDDKFKRGFLVNVFSPKIGGIREFSSTAGAVNEVVNKLYDEFDSAPERAQGMLPVIACTGVTPTESKHGTNYKPVMVIEKWTKRPNELSGSSKPAAVISAPAAVIPPPAAPVAVPAEDDPF